MLAICSTLSSVQGSTCEYKTMDTVTKQIRKRESRIKGEQTQLRVESEGQEHVEHDQRLNMPYNRQRQAEIKTVDTRVLAEGIVVY